MTQAAKKPNVVVFFTDQQRWDTSGLHGNPMDLMPNFDRYAIGGTHLYHTFTCQPVCGPARSVMQTGLYPTETGCYRNAVPLPQEVPTLGHYFQDAGYHTGYIGKWHLAAEEPVPAHKRTGYDYWLASNSLEHSSEPYRTLIYDNDNQPVVLPGYRVDALTDAAIAYMTDRVGPQAGMQMATSPTAANDQTEAQAQGDQPFFLFLSYLEPHHQNRTDDYPPPDGYRERYTSRWIPPDLQALSGTAHQHLGGYYGMVKRLDEALGRLMDALRSMGQLDNTVVLFASDHACHFKTRNQEYKRSCHEASIRIPSAIWGPGFENGGQIRELVSLIDLPPTLLDAAGIEVPARMQGHSLLPLVDGGRAARDNWPKEMFVQISETQVGRAIRTQKWKYSVSSPGSEEGRTAYGTIDGSSDSYTEEFLYDLEADPYELTNLIGMPSHREVADLLQQRLIARMVEAGESAPTIHPAPPTAGGQRKVTDAEARA